MTPSPASPPDTVIATLAPADSEALLPTDLVASQCGVAIRKPAAVRWRLRCLLLLLLAAAGSASAAGGTATLPPLPVLLLVAPPMLLPPLLGRCPAPSSPPVAVKLPFLHIADAQWVAAPEAKTARDDHHACALLHLRRIGEGRAEVKVAPVRDQRSGAVVGSTASAYAHGVAVHCPAAPGRQVGW